MIGLLQLREYCILVRIFYPVLNSKLRHTLVQQPKGCPTLIIMRAKDPACVNGKYARRSIFSVDLLMLRTRGKVLLHASVTLLTSSCFLFIDTFATLSFKVKG